MRSEISEMNEPKALTDVAASRDLRGGRESAPCALASMGMITSLGQGADEIWPRLLAADQSRFAKRTDLVPDCSLLVAEVAEPLPEIPARLHRYACRNNALIMAALQQIEKPIAETIADVGRDRIAVVIGSSTSGVGDAEAAIRHRHATGELAKSFYYDQLEFGGASSFVADLLQLDGPTYAISTACSSGARALATARSLLALDVCDAVIAGAADSLCGLTANGFWSLQLVSDEVTNPCSVNRKGLTLGEGAAVFLVTRERGGIQLRGVGESTEAHHMSAPDPAGSGAEQAMRGALKDAQMEPAEIAYLNLHGTGTLLNDAMECAAIARIFAEAPPSSSTKSLVGHVLGGAGAIEAGICWLILEEGNSESLDLVPHAFDGQLDPALSRLRLVPREGMRVMAGPVMTNSFGFGGNNCTLILERERS
jgi:3-oxoacyl-[acyl-carrier-protein] synthase-1